MQTDQPATALKGYVKNKAHLCAAHMQAQLDRFADHGVPPENIFFYDGSEDILQNIKPGDKILINNYSEIANSLIALMDILCRVIGQGAVLRSIEQPWLDLHQANSAQWLRILQGFGILERQMRSEITRKGLEQVRSQGKRLGRPRHQGETVQQKIYKKVFDIYSSCDISVKKLCLQYEVDYSSFYRYIKENRLELRRKPVVPSGQKEELKNRK